jgi:hypothetical protein
VGGVLTLSSSYSSHYQTSRQRQKRKGRRLLREGKGSSSTAHRRKQINTTCFIHLQLLPSWGFRHLLAIVSPYKPQTGGPVRAHPGLYEFATDLQIGTPHWLYSWAASQAHTFFHTLSHSTLLPPHSLNLGDTVSPQKAVTRMSHWELIRHPFCP